MDTDRIPIIVAELLQGMTQDQYVDEVGFHTANERKPGTVWLETYNPKNGEVDEQFELTITARKIS